uniref:Uncharacterized protein n=1 Tax=Arundo donax TaxID=35708 RepID=A0A0A9AEY9_ARUDO
MSTYYMTECYKDTLFGVVMVKLQHTFVLTKHQNHNIEE